MKVDFDCTQIENYDDLRRLQLCQLEILKYLDKFCKKNNIHYSLCGGTLLGAVRHGGFIPWDDDLDICMLRSEYNRFIDLWNESPHDGYIIQTKDNSPKFTQSFAKIRKNHTTFFQQGEEPGIYHMGIFIDVFPMDRIPNGLLNRYLFFWQVIKYQIFVREFIPPDINFVLKAFLKLVYTIIPSNVRKKKRDRLLKKITEHYDNPDFRLVGIDTIATMRKTFSPNLWDKLTTIEFEGDYFPCFSNWKEYLSIFYGDYMKLPPKEEQIWYHHPIILDFEHNFEDLNIDK